MSPDFYKRDGYIVPGVDQNIRTLILRAQSGDVEAQAMLEGTPMTPEEHRLAAELTGVWATGPATEDYLVLAPSKYPSRYKGKAVEHLQSLITKENHFLASRLLGHITLLRMRGYTIKDM
jgi:hypothetical protein